MKYAVKLVVLKVKRQWRIALAVTDQFQVRNSTFLYRFYIGCISIKFPVSTFNELSDLVSSWLRYTKTPLSIHPIQNFPLTNYQIQWLMTLWWKIIPRPASFYSKKVVEKISVSILMNLSKSAMQILTAFCFTAIEKTSPNCTQKIPL